MVFGKIWGNLSGLSISIKVLVIGDAFKFPCISCDSKWANGPVLNMHLKVDHKMPEIHTCDKCGKCLKKKVSLLSHIKVDHENIKDHVCHLCGRGFARQQVTIALHVQILVLLSILKKSKLFWGKFTVLWVVLVYFGVFWYTLGYFGDTLRTLWGTFCVLLGHFR